MAIDNGNKISMSITIPAKDVAYEHEARKNMRMQIAEHLIDKAVQVTEHYWGQEHRIDLYVFTPEEFWTTVHEEARKLSSRLHMGHEFR